MSTHYGAMGQLSEHDGEIKKSLPPAIRKLFALLLERTHNAQ